jgi:hypothetical protein
MMTEEPSHQAAGLVQAQEDLSWVVDGGHPTGMEITLKPAFFSARFSL